MIKICLLFLLAMIALSAHFTAIFKTRGYQYNEGPNKNRCTNDWQCDGLRTCSLHKWCQGKAR